MKCEDILTGVSYFNMTGRVLYVEHAEGPVQISYLQMQILPAFYANFSETFSRK
jgi:hypothetical protein